MNQKKPKIKGRPRKAGGLLILLPTAKRGPCILGNNFYKVKMDVSFHRKQFEKFLWKLKVFMAKRDKKDEFEKKKSCDASLCGLGNQTSSTLVFPLYYRMTVQQGIKRCPSLI